MISGQVECELTGPGDSHLKRAVRKDVGVVRAVIELLRQSRVHVRNVELLEIIVAVERPVRSDQIIAGSFLVAPEFLERHPRHSLVDWCDPFAEWNCRIERCEKQ